MDVLSIPSVLRAILENLDSKRVALCRLVNTAWNHEACKILQSRVVISFSSTEQLSKFNDTYESSLEGVSVVFQSFYFSSLLFVTAVEDIVLESLEILRENLKRFALLSSDNVTELRLCVHPILTLSSQINFFHQQRSTIMYTEVLEMIYAYFPNLFALKLLFVASSSSKSSNIMVDYETVVKSYASVILPNLRKVEIDANILEERSNTNLCEEEALPLEQRMVTLFAKTLLRSAINLQIISCKNSLPHPIIERSLLECFSEKSTLSSLKCINLRLMLSGDKLNSLCDKPFVNLNTVNLEIDSSSVTDSDLKQFFLRRNSLQKLYLAFNKSAKLFARLPLGVMMTKLRSLTLEQFQGSIHWEILPGLKQLSLKHSNLEQIVSNVPKDWSVESLEIEKCLDQKNAFECDAFTDSNFLLHLNLLSINNVSHCVPLSLIFTQCNQLTVLSIQKCEGVTDPVLCGIRKSFLSMLSLEPQNDYAVKDNQDSLFKCLIETAKSHSQAGIREQPFIGNLKGLQKLVLEGDFSDLSVLYGIIHCERLIDVNLRSAMCTWRSFEIIRQAGLLHLINTSINGRTFQV